MKPAPFRYHRPKTIDEAVQVLAADEGAKVLAGGQSLVPMLNFRLATPTTLVDVGRLPGLDAIATSGSHVTIGATVRQREAELSDEVRGACALIPHGLHHVGHVQIRNRGTLCGSIAHADPASELPAIALALEAELVARGPGGERVIPANEFFVAPYWTALDSSEVVVAVRFPIDPTGSVSSVKEYARRSGDFALAGVAMRAAPDGDGKLHASLAAFGVGATPIRLRVAEEAVAAGGSADELRDALRQDVPEPTTDLQASSAYRFELLAAMTAEVVRDCRSQIER